MDTAKAFAYGEANRHKEMKIFDWDRCAEILRDLNNATASAGLAEDWEWTGGTIYSNGEIVTNKYTFVGSTWATPILRIHTEDDETDIECWKYQSELPEFNAETKWPESARRKLNDRNQLSSRPNHSFN